MDKTKAVILGCTICTLICAGVATTIGYMFHPSKSNAATKLRRITQCSECVSGKAKNTETCEGCHVSNDKNTVPENPYDCPLSNETKRQLSEKIKKRIINGGVQSWQKFALTKSRDWEHNYTATEFLEYMGRNVPRPSAHWFLQRHRKTPQKTTMATATRNIKNFVSNTGTEIAHSEDGISNKNGQMEFANSGWYQIYFQFTIKPTSSPRRFRNKETYKVLAILIRGREKKQQKYLIQPERAVKSNHRGIAHQHVTLKGSAVYKIFSGDLLTINITMPGEVYPDTDMSKSYLGAMYLRQHLSALS